MNKNSAKNRFRRLVGVEVLEDRRLLSADVLQVGAVYYESAPTEVGSGRDTAADYIYVAFSGGAENTQLTEVTIDMNSFANVTGTRHSFIDLGSQNPSGVSGAYGSVPLEFETEGCIVTGYTLTENNTLLTVHLSGMEAGDVLKIKCDVDEVLAEGIIDAEVTGAEFSLTSTISVDFSAEYYEDLTIDTMFFKDVFAAIQAKYDIPGLPNDDFNNEYATIPPGDGLPQPVYTAGAFDSAVQVPLPCTLSGQVFEDVDYDWQRYEAGTDNPLENVQINLYKLNSSTGLYELSQTTYTDANGNYEFEIDPGTYKVYEIQPDGFMDVTSFVGTINGIPMGTQISANELTDITVKGGQDSIRNDFSEFVPAEISGYVWAELDKDGIYTPGTDIYLEGVQIDLLNAAGSVISTTYTNASGYYEFTNLLPGTYGVYEHQPVEYLNGGQYVGTVDGVKDGQISAIDLTDHIVLVSRDVGVHYDFWEYQYAQISGYVFQDGSTLVLKEGESLPSNLWDLYPGVRDASDNPISGVKLTLGDASGNPVLDAHGNEIVTYTDSKGYYRFTNVKPGTYTILEEHPVAYRDGWDTPGSLGGATTSTKSNLGPDADKLYNINVEYGDDGVEYNFSEILIEWVKKNEPGGGTKITPPPTKVVHSSGGSAPVTPYSYTPYFGSSTGISLGGGSGGAGNTFHLGVLSGAMTTVGAAQSALAAAGAAGAAGVAAAGATGAAGAAGIAGATGVAGVNANTNANATASILLNGTQATVRNGLNTVLTSATSLFDPNTWEGLAMDRIRWMLAENANNPGDAFFGVEGARALTGDFNGDGKDELAIFLDGYWFIDINGNRVWDDFDLWVQMGGRGDQPIVGDWDGDGKADIGVYGHPWKNDSRVLAYEFGLPDAQNARRGEYKNIPSDKAIAGYWYAKHTKNGEIKRDVIDHVFQIGQDGDIAVAGDWNGDGVWSVGVFHDGQWALDTNGDGRIDQDDDIFQFGEKGDLPVVGSWDGSGISRVGVYRDGVWTLDTHGSRSMANAQIVRRGNPGELPIVADFEGQGTPELATVRNAAGPEVEIATSPDGSVTR